MAANKLIAKIEIMCLYMKNFEHAYKLQMQYQN